MSVSTATPRPKDRFSTASGLAGTALLILVLAISTTSGLGYGASWFDEQRILCIVGLSLAVLILVATGAKPESEPATLLLSVAAFGLVSCIHAQRSALAFYDWSLYVLLAYWVLSVRFTDDRWRAVAAAGFGVAPAAAYGAGVVANYVSSWLVGIPVGDGTFLVGFSNPRFAAQLELLTLPFLHVAYRLAPSRGWRIAAGVVAAIWWMCLFGSSSRTAWISLLIAAGVLSFAGPACRKLLRWQLAVAALGLVLYLILFRVLPVLSGLAPLIDDSHAIDATSVGARVELARIAINMALSHPLLGVGPMHFAYPWNYFGAHPHNFWLQLAAEWGLVATAIIVALVLLLGVRLIRIARAAQADAPSSTVLSASLAALILWFAGTQADGFMVVPTSQVASALVLMFAYQASSGPTVPAVAETRVAAVLWRAMALLALAVFVSLPFNPFGAPTAREATWRSENPQALLWPRFWGQGWIGPDQDATAR